MPAPPLSCATFICYKLFSYFNMERYAPTSLKPAVSSLRPSNQNIQIFIQIVRLFFGVLNLPKEAIIGSGGNYPMAEIIHRYINGTEVAASDLMHYQITDKTILEIIRNAIRRNSHLSNTPSTNELFQTTYQ